MLNRLNGWQRIGVILSVLWAVFVIFVAAFNYNSSPVGAGPFVELVTIGPDPAGLERFDFEEKDGSRTSYTWNEFTGKTAMLTEPHLKFGPLLLWLLAPIVLGWLLVYILIFVARWVIVGFKARD